MKVYIVTKEGFPNGMAATNRIKCYARAIHEGGLECEVVVCGSTEVSGRPRNTEAVGEYEGVPFRYIGGTTMDYRPKPIRLLSQYIKLLQTESYLKSHLNKGDVVLLYLGQRVKQVLRFIRIIKKKGAFSVLDLCEYPYGTKNSTKANHLRKLVFEEAFPHANGIISISDSLYELAKSKTPPSCRHIKIPIMVEYEHYSIEKKDATSPVPYIFHAGTLSEQKDGVLGMIEAFGIAKKELQLPVKYYLTGSLDSSPEASKIRDLIEKYKLGESVEFIGYLFRDQVKEYLKGASLVISNRPKSLQDYYGFSTKVGEYLASGTPFITTRWGEVVNWVDSESAYIVEPENVKELAEAIVKVFRNPHDAEQIGIKGQEICKKCFDFRNWSTTLASFVKSLH